jgi:hypothetical protein
MADEESFGGESGASTCFGKKWRARGKLWISCEDKNGRRLGVECSLFVVHDEMMM